MIGRAIAGGDRAMLSVSIEHSPSGSSVSPQKEYPRIPRVPVQLSLARSLARSTLQRAILYLRNRGNPRDSGSKQPRVGGDLIESPRARDIADFQLACLLPACSLPPSRASRVVAADAPVSLRIRFRIHGFLSALTPPPPLRDAQRRRCRAIFSVRVIVDKREGIPEMDSIATRDEFQRSICNSLRPSFFENFTRITESEVSVEEE